MLKLIAEHDEWKERADVFEATLKAAYNERDILRAELDNRQMQLDGEHTTCVELSRHVYDLEEELAQARADIERKEKLIELLQAQIAALKALEVFGRLFQIADELDDKAGTPGTAR